MYIFTFFFISTYSTLGLRVSNHNENKNYRYNDTSYYYNKNNKLGKILPLADDRIKTFGARPAPNIKYSPIGISIVFYKQSSNM